MAHRHWPLFNVTNQRAVHIPLLHMRAHSISPGRTPTVSRVDCCSSEHKGTLDTPTGVLLHNTRRHTVKTMYARNVRKRHVYTDSIKRRARVKLKNGTINRWIPYNNYTELKNRGLSLYLQMVFIYNFCLVNYELDLVKGPWHLHIYTYMSPSINICV